MSLRDKQYIFEKRNIAGVILMFVTLAAGVYMDSVAKANMDYSFTVYFSRGTNILSQSKSQIDEVVQIAQGNSNYKITVEGHTGTRGKSEANVVLGLKRAEVIRTMLQDRNVMNEINVEGVGSANPLKRKSGEREAIYQSRLSRAVIKVESNL